MSFILCQFSAIYIMNQNPKSENRSPESEKENSESVKKIILEIQPVTEKNATKKKV